MGLFGWKKRRFMWYDILEDFWRDSHGVKSNSGKPKLTGNTPMAGTHKEPNFSWMKWIIIYFSEQSLEKMNHVYRWWSITVTVQLEDNQFSSVKSLSHVRLFVTPWTAARQASLSITVSQSLPKLMSVESVMASHRLILCHLLIPPPSIVPYIRVFSSESALCIRWPRYWSFSFSTSPSSEYSGLISFRINWLHLLSVQGTLKSLLQHHSSKVSEFTAKFLRFLYF